MSNTEFPQGANRMSFPTTLPAAIVETVLNHLAALFLTGAGGDMAAARHAADHMLGAYHPQTTDELRLVAKIIGFSLHALEALGQAAAPDMPLTRILRLRGSAVSLSREAAKAERRLGQLVRARLQAIPEELVPSEPGQPEPKIEKAMATIKETGQIAVAAAANGLTWTQAHQQHQRDRRINARVRRVETQLVEQANAAIYAATMNHHDRTMERAG